MNIAAYCRVSTDKTDQLNSLETQKNFFKEYTDKNGYNLVRVYADEGISGTKTKNRKQFLQLMKDAKMGLFNMVVVKDISRFARNTVDLLENIRKLKSYGINVIFLTANMESMGESEFVLTVFGALAQEESANTSKRVKFGKKENAKKGRVPNIVYGYDKTIGDYFNLTVNEKEAEVVRQIYAWYLNGYGASKIANKLNEQGLRTKRDCKFSQNAICRILTNELYTGKIINGKQEVKDFLTGVRRDNEESEWIVTERPELRIVEQNVFEKAQEILRHRHKAFNLTGERQSDKYLFSTIIKCKECGWSFRRVERTYKNTYVRWVCSGRNGNGKDSCPNVSSIEENELIQMLDEYIKDYVKNRKQAITRIRNEFIRVYKSQHENEQEESRLQEQLEAIMGKRQKYMDMYTDDLISRDELKREIGGMKIEIERLQSKLKLVSCHLDKGEQLEELISKTFKEMENIVSVRDMTNEQLRHLVQKIEVDKDGNMQVSLRLFDDLGLENSVLISDNHT